ncbi:hypothetical protein K470DRAFT_220935 [Piedraia hortae CBS 480.64]|uniref:BRCT domain-containing protein n=1 Tax=Piedraia hortae CBS 480.64 TaxID=1314780 RepID=A0A6A7BV38_9PEZI|nr:hypothetical protein K470DRAFT_220935 [Piedraia hortae CBS 480.64]
MSSPSALETSSFTTAEHPPTATKETAPSTAVSTEEAISTRTVSPRAVSPPTAQETANSTPPSPPPVHTNRIFALFKGTYHNFYPATYLSTVTPTTYSVIFDDTTPTTLPAHQVRSLSLRVGDRVKLDRAGMRKETYTITKLGRHATPSQNLSDINGHISVWVKPHSKKSKSPETEVLVTNIYLTHTLWKAFAARPFTPQGRSHGCASRPTTPAGSGSHPPTPGSRPRRAPSPGNLPSKSAGLFSNMAFAISLGSNTSYKSSLTSTITAEGGTILEGFDALFTPTDFTLHPHYENLGFVALLADRHSRREKYMQALALGIPTLSHRWVKECVGERGVVGWEKFLLPAGESVLLDGAVRSRTLPGCRVANATLGEMLRNRDLLLRGVTVIMVGTKRGGEEKRRTYEFLLRALGAEGVHNVEGAKEGGELARTLGSRVFVYVHGRGVQDAAAGVFGKKGKRKRGENGLCVSDGRVTVVNDEFVVQSLILGCLV